MYGPWGNVLFSSYMAVWNHIFFYFVMNMTYEWTYGPTLLLKNFLLFLSAELNSMPQSVCAHKRAIKLWPLTLNAGHKHLFE